MKKTRMNHIYSIYFMTNIEAHQLYMFNTVLNLIKHEKHT